jgi:hypothetical protein
MMDHRSVYMSWNGTGALIGDPNAGMRKYRAALLAAFRHTLATLGDPRVGLLLTSTVVIIRMTGEGNLQAATCGACDH